MSDQDKAELTSDQMEAYILKILKKHPDILEDSGEKDSGSSSKSSKIPVTFGWNGDTLYAKLPPVNLLASTSKLPNHVSDPNPNETSCYYTKFSLPVTSKTSKICLKHLDDLFKEFDTQMKNDNQRCNNTKYKYDSTKINSTIHEEPDDFSVSTDNFTRQTIEIVQCQVSTSSQKAIDALRKSNGDIVNAIMELTF